MQNLVESLERATLDAVAPVETQEVDGWLLPFDDSTVGRAISAVPLRHEGEDGSVVHTVLACYAARARRAQFRIADVPGLGGVHRTLQACGFAPFQATLTMVGSIQQLLSLGSQSGAEVQTRPSAGWKSVYVAPGFDPVDGAHRVQALSRSTHVVYAHACDDSGAPVAAGTASLSHGWAGLHGMRTVPAARQRGLAQYIIAGLAATAQQRGFERVFLQVEESNLAARKLYTQLGFEVAWRYHYWRSSAPTDAATLC